VPRKMARKGCESDCSAKEMAGFLGYLTTKGTCRGGGGWGGGSKKRGTVREDGGGGTVLRVCGNLGKAGGDWRGGGGKGTGGRVGGGGRGKSCAKC